MSPSAKVLLFYVHLFVLINYGLYLATHETLVGSLKSLLTVSKAHFTDEGQFTHHEEHYEESVLYKVFCGSAGALTAVRN